MNTSIEIPEEEMPGRVAVTIIIHQPVVNITNGVLCMADMAKRALSMLPHAESDTEDSPAAPSCVLNAEEVSSYVGAGLLTEDLHPAPDLSRGEKALLAHDIGVRLKIPNFWSFFEHFWKMNNMSAAYQKFRSTQKSVDLQKRLISIK